MGTSRFEGRCKKPLCPSGLAAGKTALLLFSENVKMSVSVDAMTNEQLLERVQQMDDTELDQRLSNAAYNKGWEDAARGKPMGLYWIERYQADYELGYRGMEGLEA